MSTLTIKFPDNKSLEAFLVYLSDSGGESQFFDCEERVSKGEGREGIDAFDYSKVYPIAKHIGDTYEIAALHLED